MHDGQNGKITLEWRQMAVAHACSVCARLLPLLLLPPSTPPSRQPAAAAAAAAQGRARPLLASRACFLRGPCSPVAVDALLGCWSMVCLIAAQRTQLISRHNSAKIRAADRHPPFRLLGRTSAEVLLWPLPAKRQLITESSVARQREKIVCKWRRSGAYGVQQTEGGTTPLPAAGASSKRQSSWRKESARGSPPSRLCFAAEPCPGSVHTMPSAIVFLRANLLAEVWRGVASFSC
jgi:hypothetical protein